jgi:hypothetical protein
LFPEFPEFGFRKAVVQNSAQTLYHWIAGWATMQPFL